MRIHLPPKLSSGAGLEDLFFVSSVVSIWSMGNIPIESKKQNGGYQGLDGEGNREMLVRVCQSFSYK